jgi:hypothetical protein
MIIEYIIYHKISTLIISLTSLTICPPIIYYVNNCKNKNKSDITNKNDTNIIIIQPTLSDDESIIGQS